MVPEEDMCYSCFEATKYSCIECTNAICNRCSAFESNEETPGWIAGEAVGYCLPCKQEEGIEVKTIIIITLKECYMQCGVLKSNEDMILALVGQFKQLSHEPEKFR